MSLVIALAWSLAAAARPEVEVTQGRVEARTWELSAAWRTSGFWLSHPGVAVRAESLGRERVRTVDREDPKRDRVTSRERFAYVEGGANWFPGNDLLVLATPGVGWRRVRARGLYGGGQLGWSVGRFQLATPTWQLNEAGEAKRSFLAGNWVTGAALGAHLGVDATRWRNPRDLRLWVAPTLHLLFPYNTGLAPTWQVDFGFTLPFELGGARP